MKIKKTFLILLCFLTFIFNTKLVDAVIPPDFIFSIGVQVVQFFSVIAIFFLAVFGTMYQFFKQKFYALKYPKITVISIVILIVVSSLLSAYFYANYKQESEYEKWLEESRKNEIRQGQTEIIINENVANVSENSEAGVRDYVEIETGNIIKQNDQLEMGENANENIDLSSEKFISSIIESDESAAFINQYYKNIANQNLQEAYEMSKKSVNFETFQSWYNNTNKITLNKLIRIDKTMSSIELTLYEGDKFTRYGVLMTLSFQNDIPVRIENSEVKILTEGIIKDNKIDVSDSEENIDQSHTFFNGNKNKSLFITNEEFKNATESQKDDFIVLDVRENIEYENGYFEGSVHIRFVDLTAGRWIELPKDKHIYVLCWSGMRGKEVAEFLRTKKLTASYLEEGASGWVKFGGDWTGDINFVDKYTAARYQKVFNTGEVRKKENEGVVLVDTREPFKFEQWHIEGSINLPIIYTTSLEMENKFSQIPVGSRVITVCDGYVNCFDAKLTGVELERRGYEFLGRYNKPWEYEK